MPIGKSTIIGSSTNIVLIVLLFEGYLKSSSGVLGSSTLPIISC